MQTGYSCPKTPGSPGLRPSRDRLGSIVGTADKPILTCYTCCIPAHLPTFRGKALSNTGQAAPLVPSARDTRQLKEEKKKKDLWVNIQEKEGEMAQGEEPRTCSQAAGFTACPTAPHWVALGRG